MPANTPGDPDANDSGSSLHWGTSSFEPGGDVGLVARHTVGLIERDNPSTRERLWQLVAADASLDDILDELSSTGLKALPDFGIAQVEGDAVRVVARGRTSITAELGSGDRHEIDASDVRTWVEEVVADVVGLTIALAPLDDEGPLSTEAFAVLAGSVPARSMTRRFDVADPHAEDAAAGWVAQPHAAGDTDAAPSVAPGAADASESGSAPVTELEAAEAADLEMVEPDEAQDAESWFEDNADDSPRTAVPPQPEPPAVEAASEPPVADPQPASPQPAGPPVADPQPASPQPAGPPVADPQPASPQPAGPPVADPQPASPQPAGPPAASGVTADPFHARRDDGPSDPPPTGPGTGGPPPEATVVVGSADGPARGPVSSIFDDEVAAESVVPTLPSDDATAAPSGADPGDTAAPRAATVHGVLAFSNGERIDVDRSVLIGRNPKVAGAVEGGLPHIMKFEGPGQGLSRTHAEVRIEQGEMLLEDLQSTNGTEVQLPGQQRRRLRGGEPVVVVPGTLIDFGDELHCTVETAG